jgi:predicted PurR-regulated permease PerM
VSFGVVLGFVKPLLWFLVDFGCGVVVVVVVVVVVQMPDDSN